MGTPRKESEAVDQPGGEEVVSPVQWTRGGRAGQVTDGSRDGNARIISMLGENRCNSSPSVGSEPVDLASASASAEQTQHLGAPPGTMKAELSIGNKGHRSPLSSPPTPGRTSWGEGRRQSPRQGDEK